MKSNPIIIANNISKFYPKNKSSLGKFLNAIGFSNLETDDKFYALKNISFSINTGECIGIIGANGAGKSTLLEILSGVTSKSSGELHVLGRVSPLLELGASFNEYLTGVENINFSSSLQGLSKNESREKLRFVKEFSDLGDFLDKPISIYSSGMFARLAFANAIYGSPDILIVDEILGVGDAKFQERCFNKIQQLKNAGTTILFTSHNSDTILRNCTKSLLLQNGELILYSSTEECLLCYENMSSLLVNNLVPEKNFNKSNIIVNKFERRFGNRQAEIHEISLFSNNQKLSELLSGNESLEIYFKVKTKNLIINPVIGFGITTVDGIVIAGSNSMISDFSYPPLNINSVYVFKISITLNLSGGEYFLNLGISSNNGDELVVLDERRSVATLKVKLTPQITGFSDFKFCCHEIIKI